MNHSTSQGQLVLSYFIAFNSRNIHGMRASFSSSLVSIHPDDQTLDVASAEPFITRMTSLWEKDYYYHLRDLAEPRSLISPPSCSMVFAEFSIGVLGLPPVATELARYRCSQLIDEITVYKIFHPTHPYYQLHEKSLLLQ